MDGYAIAAIIVVWWIGCSLSSIAKSMKLASVGTRPKGGDAHAAPALPSDAVGAAETPNLSRPIPDTLNAEGCE